MVSYPIVDSPILGTAVGLVLLFATTALLCSGVVETISNIFQVRAKYLLTGLRSMLDDPGARVSLRGTGVHDDIKNTRTVDTVADRMRQATPTTAPNLTTAIFESPLLRSLQSHRVGALRSKLRKPQYVSAAAFARAFVDFLVPPTEGAPPPADAYLAKVREAVIRMPEEWPVRDQLLAYLARAGTVEQFEEQLGQWYDEQMAKISGWYKRWARLVLGVVGFAVAFLGNVDTLAVAHALYVDAPLQQAVAATADTGTLCQAVEAAQRTACTTQALEALRAGGVPLGWPFPAPLDWWAYVLKGLGWVITAFAVSFGAPFWFEALSKLGSLRTTGTRPQDAAPTYPAPR